jgi:hypothetical protein
MRKLTVATIIFIIFVSVFVGYTEWEKRRFINSLPKPLNVKQTVETHSHHHDEPEQVSPSNIVDFESEVIVEEHTDSAELPSNDEFQPADDSPPADDWRFDVADIDESAHQHTSPSFEQRLEVHPDEMDPDELADMLLQGLLQRFGDIPEVHTFMALKRRMFKKEHLNLDEYIDYTAAQLHLFPHPETQKTLDILLERRATEYPRGTKLVR